MADHVILDDLHPFSRKSRVHRAKIRTPDGYHWLTIPVLTEDRRKPINQVRIDHTRPWVKNHLRALEYNYRNSLYFDFYEPEIKDDFRTAAEYSYLTDVINHLFQRQCVYFEIELYAKKASEFYNDQDEMYQNLTKSKSFVWQEQDSKNYQRPHWSVATFRKPDVTYRQHYPGFVEGCSMLDLLFEYGPDSWQILDRFTEGR